jgi:DNA-binding CsgD family transcriptional regulator
VPFLVEELAGADPQDAASVPDSVRDLVLLRTRSLAPRARRLLGAAAVAATALDEPALSEVSDLPVAEVEIALRDLVDAHLLVVDRTWGRYECRHALLREAVTADLLAAEAGRLHRRCAELFQTRADLASPSGRADALIAHHWWMAADDERAYASAAVAADGAREVHAYDEELALRRRALDLWPLVQQQGARDAPDRAELLWRAAKAADRVGEPDVARELYQEARRELILEEEPGRVAEVLFDEVGLLAHLADMPDTETATRRVLAVLPAEPSLARARALVALQAFHYQRREIDDLCAVTQDAILVADQVGAAGLTGRAQLILIAAGAAHWDEHPFTVQQRVRALAAEAGDTDLLLSTYINESDGHLGGGCFAEAERLAREGQRLAVRRGGALDHHDLLLINLVCALIATGDWAEAETLLDDALLVDRPGAIRANLYGYLSEVRLAQGDLDGAERAADEAQQRLKGPRLDPQSYPPTAAAQGELALAKGRAAEALEIVRGTFDEVGESVWPFMVWPLLYVAARAIPALGPGEQGRWPDATTWLRRAAAHLPDRQHTPGWAEAVEAELSGGHIERWRVALAAVEEAAGEEAQAPVLLRLRVLLAAARAELSAGSRGDARNLLDRVLRDAEQLGARLVLDEARDFAQRSRLILAGAEREPAIFGLTGRELEVLRLVAAGMSNRQIGGALFLSPKTVSVHVSHILTKLGVASRGEAAALAFSQGLA